MKTAFSSAPLSKFRPVICLAAAAGYAGAARAQSLAEALDTPGVIWSARGKVSTVSGPDLTWDGVDAVRVDPDPALEMGERSSVGTEIAEPSLVTFRRRSRDLDGTANFSVAANGEEDTQYGASLWRETARLVVLEGELRISTWEGPGGNPLFLDHVVITPAPVVSLSEALDAPGLVFTPLDAESRAAGIRDAELAPDGEDAVWFTGRLSLAAPAAPDGMVVSYAGSADPGRPFAQSRPEDARSKKQFLADPAGETVTWRPAWNERTLDQVALTPAVPLSVALDAPGLTFEALPQPTGPRFVAFGTADAPAGAKNGNAVAIPSQYGAPGLRASGFTGPGVLRYSEAPFPPYWNRQAVGIPAGVTGYDLYTDRWLDDFVFEPGVPDLATLMGQPGADVTLVHPDRATGVPSSPGETEEPALRLEEWPGAEPSSDGLLRISCEGPSMVSFSGRGNYYAIRATADGSPNLFFEGSLFDVTKPVFALTFSEPGPHEVRVLDPGLLSRLRVRPLVEVPLEVALDAPGMAFTTSPDTPWRGYVTDDSLGAEGGHAACGGIHSGGAEGSGDPWLETTVTGPGVLRFTPARTASRGAGSMLPSALTVTMDGLRVSRPDMYDGWSAAVPVGAGTHKVRWIQNGANVLAEEGDLVWLDRVSFTPLTAEETVSIGTALRTGDRAWSTSGGADAVSAAPTAGVYGINGTGAQFNPSRGPATLSTRVERPFIISITYKHLTVSVDGVPVETPPPSGYYEDNQAFTFSGNGVGTALVEFSTVPGSVGFLDTVRVYTQAPAATAPGGNFGSDSLWSIRGNGLTWLENTAEQEEEGWGITLYTPDAARGTNFLEAVIPGPFSCSSALVLPDRGFRFARDRVTFPGPNRVRLGPYEAYDAPGAGTLTLPAIRPAIPLATATGAPELPWETGGDAPWMGEKALWSADTVYAVSGTVIPGEHSWIQTTVNGPGVLRWRIPRPLFGGSVPPIDSVDRITVNDAVVPGANGSGYLHLPSGPQRVRWWHSATLPARNGAPTDLKLAEVKFEPPPSPSLQEITGLADMAFHYPRHEPIPRSAPLRNIPSPPWEDLKVWTPLTVDGRSAVRQGYNTGFPEPVLPTPGEYVVTSMARSEEPPSPYSNYPNSAWGPHPWMPKTFRARAGASPDLNQLITDSETLLDSAVWRPAEETGLAEALDTPGREWTSGSAGFGAWRAYAWPDSGNGSGADADPDFVQCLALTGGTEAWLETRVTGPARVTVTWDDGVTRPQFPTPALPTPLNGFQILVDGAEALRDPLRHFAQARAAEVSVPAGVHALRLRWGPFSSDPVPLVISRVAVTPETNPGVDIGALVEAPELPWYAQGGMGIAADAHTSRDGVDSARLEFPAYPPDPGSLVTTVTGPGVFRAYVRGEPRIEAGGLTRVPIMDSQGFRPVEFALPPGRQVIRFQKKAALAYHLDSVSWKPLPALSAEAALAVVTPPPGSGTALPVAFEEGVAYAGYPGDGSAPESVLIPEGSAAAVRIRVPVPCRITFSARALSAPGEGETSPVLTAAPVPVPIPADSWKTLTFTSDDLNLPDGWLTLGNEGGAVLIDDLVVTPYDGNAFLPAMATAGLTGAAGGVNADPDGDGLVNLLEHAFGRDSARNDTARGGDGMPEVSTFRDESDGLTYLRVRFRGRYDADSPLPPVTYTVETSAGEGAAEGNPPHWTAAGGVLTLTPVIGPPGRTDMEWRSTTSVTAGPRLYVRVRASAR